MHAAPNNQADERHGKTDLTQKEGSNQTPGRQQKERPNSDCRFRAPVRDDAKPAASAGRDTRYGQAENSPVSPSACAAWRRHRSAATTQSHRRRHSRRNSARTAGAQSPRSSALRTSPTGELTTVPVRARCFQHVRASGLIHLPRRVCPAQRAIQTESPTRRDGMPSRMNVCCQPKRWIRKPVIADIQITVDRIPQDQYREFARDRSARVNHRVSRSSIAGKMQLSATPSSKRSSASIQNLRNTPVSAASNPHATSALNTSQLALVSCAKIAPGTGTGSSQGKTTRSTATASCP